MSKPSPKKNRFSVTVRDEKISAEIDKLIALKKYPSKREIINRCIEIAVPLLVSGKADYIKNTMENDIENILKKHSSILRNLTVINSIMFNLMRTLFTERSLTLDGKKTNAQDFNNGSYENLPERLQKVYEELLSVK